MDTIKKIILSRPKILTDIQCPKCKNRYIKAVPEIEVGCNNCGTYHKVPVNVNIYSAAAKPINQTLGNENEIEILAERDNSDVIHIQDELKPRSRHEDDLFHALLAIQKNFIDFGNWEVSDLTSDYDYEYRKYCTDCGYCKNCVTCTKCNKTYIPKKIKNQLRYTCPECKNKNYKRTDIKKFKKGKKLSCPHCNSTNILRSVFKEKNKCPKCHSEDITEPRKIPVYKLIIKRQKRHWKSDKE